MWLKFHKYIGKQYETKNNVLLKTAMKSPVIHNYIFIASRINYDMFQLTWSFSGNT
jgi:hypothetical protein